MIALFATAALAQSPGEPGYVAPAAAGDPYRPVVDGTRTLVTEHTSIRSGGAARADLSWAHGVVTWVGQGDERVHILRDALAVTVAGAGAVGPLRLGATAPVYLLASGEVFDGPTTALGDPTIDVKVALLPGREDGAGVALLGRVGTSLGGQARLLGHGGPFWEAGAGVDWDDGPLWLGLNAGLRGVPPQDLGVDVVLDDRAWFRLAGAFDVAERWTPSLEVAGHVPVADWHPTKAPFELLLALHHRLEEQGVVRLGLGRGITSGLGAPAFRIVLSVGL